MNTLPFAPADATFSDGLVYRFRLRPVEVDAAGRRARAVEAREWVVDCVFDAPLAGGGQSGTCTGPDQELTRFVVGEPSPEERTSGQRVFAGPRWDPFIMDAPAGLRTIAEQRLT